MTPRYYTLEDLQNVDAVDPDDLYKSFEELDECYDDLIEKYCDDNDLDELSDEDEDFLAFAEDEMDDQFNAGSFDFYLVLRNVRDDLETAAQNHEYLYTEQGLIDYQEQMVEDMGGLNGVDDWVRQYITIDYEAMAKDAMPDYANIDIGEFEFWWRC